MNQIKSQYEIVALYHWAKSDNPVEYQKLSLNYTVAESIHKMHKKNYEKGLESRKGKINWYEFKNH
jgi:hypothetical protein